MTSRLRTIFFLVLSIVFGLLAFNVRLTSDSLLIDAMFVIAVIGFIVCAVNELLTRLQLLSDATRRDHSNDSSDRNQNGALN